MTALSAMLTEGFVFGLIGALMLLEVCVLLAYWMIYRKGIAPLKLIGNVASGSCLIAALWVSQMSMSPISTLQTSGLQTGVWQSFPSESIVLLLMFLSLLFHIVDLVTSWQSNPHY